MQFLGFFAHLAGLIRSSRPYFAKLLTAPLLFLALMLLLSGSGLAQQSIYNCRPNTAGDDWICESISRTPPIKTADEIDQYNSSGTVLPEPVPESEWTVSAREQSSSAANASMMQSQSESASKATALAESPTTSEKESISAEEFNSKPKGNFVSSTSNIEQYAVCGSEQTSVKSSAPSALSEPLKIAAMVRGQAAIESMTTSQLFAAPAQIPLQTRMEHSLQVASREQTTMQTLRVAESSSPLDWMPREAMTQAQLQSLPENCCGSFVDPIAELPINASITEQTDILFQAEAGISQLSENLISIEGEVVVQQSASILKNDHLTRIDRENNTVQMEGNVVFRERGLLLTGNSALIDNDQNLNQVEIAHYVLHEFGASGKADRIVYNSDSGQVSIDNGEFSRCEPQDRFWTISADSIVLDRERNRGYANNASIRVGNVPVFYSPFTLPFPLGDARASGLLPPSIGSTRTGGFDFQLPFYLNLAPNYDATLSPRLVTDRGVMLGAEFRYLANWSMNNLNLTHLAGDDLFDPATKDTFGSTSPGVEDRWFIGFQHQGALGRYFTSYIDYNEVSDQDYFLDLDGVGLNTVSRTHLNQQGRLDFNSEFLHAGINLQRIQILDPFINAADINKPFDRLPQLHFETGTNLPWGFRLALHGEITAFDRQLEEGLLSAEHIERGALVTGERINVEPALTWAMESPGWFMRARASHQYLGYSLDQQATGTPGNPEFDVGIFSFDSGLVFERYRNSGRIQTLEPRLFYLRSEFADQSNLPLFDTSELNFSFNQLFREDRFSGGDRIADADQLTLALTSRLLNSTGREQARFSLGQIHYFKDRRVSLANPLQQWQPRYSLSSGQSAIAAEAALTMGDNWQLNTDLQWDEDRGEVIEGSFQLRYHQDRNHLFNVSYRYRNLVNSPFFVVPDNIDPRISQTDISAIWPVTPNWKILARWNYDHSNVRNLESFAGVEWSNCCTTFRLIGREWVDDAALFVPDIEPNRGVFVQITLKGLGDLTGGGISNLLQDGILGFRETDAQ